MKREPSTLLELSEELFSFLFGHFKFQVVSDTLDYFLADVLLPQMPILGPFSIKVFEVPVQIQGVAFGGLFLNHSLSTLYDSSGIKALFSVF